MLLQIVVVADDHGSIEVKDRIDVGKGEIVGGQTGNLTGDTGPGVVDPDASTERLSRAETSSVTVEGISSTLEKSPPSASITCWMVAFSHGQVPGGVLVASRPLGVSMPSRPGR